MLQPPAQKGEARGHVLAGVTTLAVETSRSTRIHQLDGLRGVAMLFVFIGHFAPIWARLVPRNGSASFFLRLVYADATLGSSFFMLLSGFFGYGSLMRGKREFGEFMRGRLWRLYPLYLIMTAVYVAGAILIPKMSKLPGDPRHAAIFLLETLFFLPGLLPIKPLMDVAWTLSFVVLFYFIECAFSGSFKAWRVRRVARFALLLGAAAAWAAWGDFSRWWEPRTTVFWIGMALWEAIDGMSGHRQTWATRLVTPAVGIAIGGVLLRTALMLDKPDTGVVSLMLLRAAITSVVLFWFVWVACFGPEWWKRLLSSSQLRKLGAASYSFYLTHGFAVKAFRFGVVPWLGPAVAGTESVFWMSQASGLVLAIMIARIVYRFVENPLSKLALRAVRPAAGASVANATRHVEVITSLTTHARATLGAG